MSQKQTKRYARVIKRQERRILRDLVREIKGMGFMARVKIAWAIVRGE